MSGSPPQPPNKTSPRPARTVIDEAIRENGQWETVCWWLVIGFSVVGALTIIVGVIWQNGMVAAAGSGAGALFWPALHYAMRIRRANIALRLLELALNNAKSKTEALTAINKAFSFHFAEQHEKEEKKSGT